METSRELHLIINVVVVIVTCLKLFRVSTMGDSDAGNVDNMSRSVITTSSRCLLIAT